jgi:hypothetical protein
MSQSERVRHHAEPPAPERLARGPVGVGGLVNRLTRPVLGQRGLAGTDIIAHWATIVGPELAALACPLSMKFERHQREGAKSHSPKSHGATLMVRVASSAAATLLQFKTPQIIDRINRYCGHQAIARLQVALGALPKAQKPIVPEQAPLSATEQAKVEEDIAPVASDAVRAALGRLGETLRRRAVAYESGR